MTVGEHIKEAMLQIGAVDITEDVDSFSVAIGISTLNAMLGSWSAQHLTLFVTAEVVHPLSVASYSIGSGATIDTPRPQKIVHAFVRDSSGADYSLDIVAVQDYQNIDDKDLTAIPEKLYYRPGHPTGTIYLWPVPTSGYTLHMETLVPLATYAAQGTAVALPPEYDEAITSNLAVRLGPKMQRPVPVEVADVARKAFAVLKRQNSQPVPEIRTDPFNRNHRYSVYGDR